MKLRIAIGMLLLFGAIAGCGGDRPEVVVDSPQLRVTSVSVGPANVFVVERGDVRVMIDSANPGDEGQIEANMRERGIDPASIDSLILTHGHIDHAGTAAYFQKTHGVKVIGGGADEPLIRNGGRGRICPTSLLARAIRWLRSGMSYTSFEIDLPIEGTLDLDTIGIDGEVFLWPGHTPGSLVIRFDDRLFVGDLIRGGILSNETPATHFFMCDLDDNREKIRRLLELPGITTWYPGHFGPLSVESVRAYLESL